jgi:hypothetical protein
LTRPETNRAGQEAGAPYGIVPHHFQLLSCRKVLITDKWVGENITATFFAAVTNKIEQICGLLQQINKLLIIRLVNNRENLDECAN